MSLAATNLDIDELEAEIAAENERRYAFYRMLSAADRVLWQLEELNLDGVKRIAEDAWGRMRRNLDGLPAVCLAVLPDSTHVQELVDGMFDVQEVLLRLRDPDRDLDDDEVPLALPEGLDDQIVARLVAGRLTPNALASCFQPELRPAVRRRARELVAAGRIGEEVQRGGPGMPRRWYVAMREGDGG